MTENEISFNVKRTTAGEVQKVTLNKTTTVLQLKEHLEKLVNIQKEMQNLIFAGKVLSDTNTLEQCGIRNECTVILIKKSKPSNPVDPPQTQTQNDTHKEIPKKGDEIPFKIKLSSVGKVYDVSFSISSTILELKQHLASIVGIESQLQTLVFKGKILKDNETLQFYKFEKDITVILVKKAAAPKNEGSNPQPNTQTNSQSNTQPNPFGNLNDNPFMNMMQGMPDLSAMGGMMGGMPGMGMNPQAMAQMLSNPMYTNMMSQMLNNPQMMQMVLNNPQIKAMTDANPQLREIFNNPETMRQILSPQNLQNMAQMMSSMGGGMGGMGGNMGGMGGMGGMPNMFNPYGMGMNPFGPNPTTSTSNTGNNTSTTQPQNAPNVDPKEKYNDQLKQLADMGFVNEETNIQVLIQCNGNVQFAVERLLNMMG